MIKYNKVPSLSVNKSQTYILCRIKFNRLFFAPVGRIVASLTVLIFSHNVVAKTLILLDKAGTPVVDAVVAIPTISDTEKVPQKIAVMDQINKQFLPRVLTITQGQQVAFPNSDDIRHHVYSFSATKPFEIKLFKGSVTTPILFDKAGIVVLGCNIHDQMVGYIYVAHNEQTFISNEQGEVVLPDSAKVIHVWHANLSPQNTKRESIDIEQLPSTNGLVQLNLNMLLPQQNNEQGQPSTYKFKKKFN